MEENELVQIRITYTNQNILTLIWPVITADNKLKFEKEIGSFLEFLRENKTERLLIDSRKSRIHIPYHEHLEIVYKFTMGLTSTSLKRVARVKSKDPMEEQRVTPGEVPSYDTEYPMEFQEYEKFKQACAWLELPF